MYNLYGNTPIYNRVFILFGNCKNRYMYIKKDVIYLPKSFINGLCVLIIKRWTFCNLDQQVEVLSVGRE